MCVINVTVLYIPIVQLFVACDDLYTQAVNFTKKCNGQLNSIQHLGNRLGQQTSADGEKDIVQYSLVKLQEEMEVISLSIKRRQEAVQKATSLYIQFITST